MHCNITNNDNNMVKDINNNCNIHQKPIGNNIDRGIAINNRISNCSMDLLFQTPIPRKT